MFRKLVSNLPFSPALVGQLGFYAKRLKKEEATRRLGLIFTALALVLQSFAVFSPPEPANASNPSDFIRGGVKSVNDVLSVYDNSARGTGDFKDIMDYAGVTRNELAAMKLETVNSQKFGKDESAILTWGREHRFSEAEGEVKHVIPRANGTSTVYSKPLHLYDTGSYSKKNGSNYQVFVGYSAKLGWFAINKDCGNLLSRKTPNPHPFGKVLTANCDLVTGFAYDGRKLDAKVQVILYFDGPPGKGERFGPILADQETPSSPAGNGHGFSIKVPDKYKRLGRAVPVHGVMIPLPGWDPSTVQMINTAPIPPHCFAPPSPGVVECTLLKVHVIERTKFKLVAKSVATEGAKVDSYTFVVVDNAGKVVADKVIKTDKSEVEFGPFDLKTVGAYNAQVVVKANVGESKCFVSMNVSPPEKCQFNKELSKNHPDCAPCPGNPNIWIKDADCAANIVLSKEAKNLTKNGVSAQNTTVKSGDRIEYSIYAENVGNIAKEVEFEENLADVLEYASLIQAGGGTFDDEKKVLNWAATTLKPNERAVRTFAVQVNDSTPATPQGVSEPGSYDCVMTNGFGNTISIKVDCPAAKLIESTVKELPSTGIGENIVFGAILIALTTYLYIRNRQLNKEIRLIRNEFNAGTI
jgi:hypothetical protein